MATLTLRGDTIHTNGELPAKGTIAPDFKLVASDLSRVSIADFPGTRLVLNIFPSVDTSTCAASVRHFNALTSELENTKVLCISHDLPFAQKRFCGAEGLENVINLSDFDGGKFGESYGLNMIDGKMQGLHARAVVVLNEAHEVIHTELVPELSEEPNYDKVLAALN